MIQNFQKMQRRKDNEQCLKFSLWTTGICLLLSIGLSISLYFGLRYVWTINAINTPQICNIQDCVQWNTSANLTIYLPDDNLMNNVTAEYNCSQDNNTNSNITCFNVYQVLMLNAPGRSEYTETWAGWSGMMLLFVGLITIVFAIATLISFICLWRDLKKDQHTTHSTTTKDGDKYYQQTDQV